MPPYQKSPVEVLSPSTTESHGSGNKVEVDVIKWR